MFWIGSGATKLPTGAADDAPGSETMKSGATVTAKVTSGVLAAARATMWVAVAAATYAGCLGPRQALPNWRRVRLEQRDRLLDKM